MTINSTAIRQTFNCDGTTTLFPINLQAYLAADFEVILTSPAYDGGGQSVLTLNSEYSLASVGSLTPPYWDLTTLGATPYGAGYTLEVIVNLTQEQQTSYTQGQAFPSAAVQANFDRLTQMVQRLQDQVNRSVRAPDGDASPTTLLPPAAQRSSMYLVTDASGNVTVGQTLAAGTILTAAIIGTFLFGAQTPAEELVGVTPASVVFAEGDLRRYGATSSIATPTSAVQTANATALNNALLVSAAGGSAVYIPPGSFYYNATVSTGNSTYGASSMYGAGSLSVLIPAAGTDGLTFVSDPNFNPPTAGRFFRDFVIEGPSATASQNNGISFPGSMGRCGGILFSNIGISNFAYGVNLQSTPNGLWASQFINCYLYNNYYGYRFYGQSISNRISGGFVQAGGMTAPTGAPTAYGMGISCDSNSGANSQGLTLDGSFQVYGYAVGGYFNLTVDIAISNSAFSVFSQTGLSIGTVQGGFFVNGCWIQAAASAANCTGINLVSIGTAIADKIVLTGNNIYGNSQAGTVGVYVGSSNNGVTVRDNTIGNGFFPFVTGITGASGVNAQNFVCEGNTIYATTTAIQLYLGAINATVGPNGILNGTPLVLSGGTPSGLVYKHGPTPMSGITAFTAATTAAVTFAVPMPSATYKVVLGGNAAGYCWPSNPTVNGFQLNCSASNSNSVNWSISY